MLTTIFMMYFVLKDTGTQSVLEPEVEPGHVLSCGGDEFFDCDAGGGAGQAATKDGVQYFWLGEEDFSSDAGTQTLPIDFGLAEAKARLYEAKIANLEATVAEQAL